MKIIKDPFELQESIKLLRAQNKTIGLVPTMGALHEGHLSLISQSQKENDITVVSIFVNPTQFGPNEDFNNYPRTFDEDREKLGNLGVDFLFNPNPSSIYPHHFNSFIKVLDPLTETLCGAKRPGHFEGVTTVVGILFHLAMPHRAYFGLKDYQQFLVIKKMAQDLFFPVKVCPVPIFRESDGLAMSSRNRYLSKEERQAAPVLYQSLKEVEQAYLSGNKKAQFLKDMLFDKISSCPLAKIDYIELLDADSLEEFDSSLTSKRIVVALAVYFGKARLIDNIILQEEIPPAEIAPILDKRRAQREKSFISVIFNEKAEGFLTNISASGCQIFIENTLDCNISPTEVTLQISIPKNLLGGKVEKCILYGQVAWKKKQQTYLLFGIQFNHQDPLQAKKIQEIVSYWNYLNSTFGG